MTGITKDELMQMARESGLEFCEEESAHSVYVSLAQFTNAILERAAVESERTARNSCDPSQKNESKQIEEVMALVIDYTNEALQFYGLENGGSHDSMNSAWSAIAAKLRELLPVWQPIESAIKQEGELIWAFNGEQAAMRYTKTPGGDLWCWLDEALSNIDPEPQQPTQWMPLPKAPE